MTNGIRRLGKLGTEWVFSKKILASCKLISDSASEYGLVYSFLFLTAGQSINRYHSAWYTTYQDSTLHVFIFYISGKNDLGTLEAHRNFLSLVLRFYVKGVDLF